MFAPSGDTRGFASGPSRVVSVRIVPLAASTAITSEFITCRSAAGPRIAAKTMLRPSGVHDSGPPSSNLPYVSWRAAPPSAPTTNRWS
jgi:hypothetical protein